MFTGSWQVGIQLEFTFPVKDHVELGLALDLFDFEAASEVFAYLNPLISIDNVLREINCVLSIPSAAILSGIVDSA